MDVAILIFGNLTALDAVGPYEVLSWVPGVDVRLVAKSAGPIHNQKGSLTLMADFAIADAPRPDILIVPGGPGEEALRWDDEVLDWLRTAHETTQWTASVCTGALLLAASGILKGVDATTHWGSMEDLELLGGIPTKERVVIRDRIITSAGVSAGIDMALTLAQLIAGDDVAQAIQLILEYDPAPPFDCGSPDKAPPHVVDLVSKARS